VVVPGHKLAGKAVAAADHGDVILEVVEVAPFMVTCRDIRSGRWVCCRM